MTDTNDPGPDGRAAALARLRDIAGFYRLLKTTFLGQIKQIGAVSDATPKALVVKLGELQSTHVMLMKAEEAFCEKFGQGDDETILDYDAIRAEIGSQLDRIRTARLAGGVSDRAE